MQVRRKARWLLIAAALLALAGCEWPMPGHDADRSGFNPVESTITPATVTRLTPVLSIPVAGGVGQPVISGSHLLVASGTTVRTFDRTTGAAGWTHDVGADSAGDPIVDAANGRVLIPNPGGGGYDASEIVSLADGSPTADTYTGGAVSTLRDTHAAVVNHDFEGSSGISAISASVTASSLTESPTWVGTVVWSSNTAVNSFRPTLGRDRLYGVLNGSVVAYDTTTPCQDNEIQMCAPLWSLPVAAVGEVVLNPDETTLYVGTSSGVVLVLDPATGAPRWTSTPVSGVVGTPALDGERLYVPMSGGLAIFSAAGCGNGGCVPAGYTGSPLAAVQPAVAGGLVYVADASGGVDAYDPTTCPTVLAGTCQAVWHGAVGGTVRGLAVVSGRLYVGTSTGVTVFGLAPA